MFAPAPPLESLRAVISKPATDIAGEPRHVRDGNSDQRTQVSVVDISRAYFCAEADLEDPRYVPLPPEHPQHGKGLRAFLLRHMYGTRSAADGLHFGYAGRSHAAWRLSCIYFYKRFI